MSDIVVIGGGIAGISAAARLSEGARVTVLEAETALGYHASGRSAALFEESYGLASTIALNRASASYHREANGGYLSPRGLLVTATQAQKAIFDQDVATMGLDLISPGEAREMVPILREDVLAHAAWRDAASDIDTDRLIQDFARVVRRNGGNVMTGQRVQRITRDRAGWTVQTQTETLSCGTLVNAAGAWADHVASLAGVAPIGLTPLRRSMARLAAPGGHDVSHWPMFFGTGEAWYAKPDAGALLVSPAEEDPCEPMDAYADDMVLAEGLARYQEMVTEAVTRPVATWAGLRSFAPDRALVLGPEPSDETFIWCAGQGGYGFQTAPAASQLVADLTLGRTPDLPVEAVAALIPDRLRG